MAWESSSRRRVFGCVILTVAVLLLALGETVLKGRLSGVSFILYWMACFVCTGVAMVVAIADLRALRERTREEQRHLVHDTLKEIESDARTRPPRQNE